MIEIIDPLAALDGIGPERNGARLVELAWRDAIQYAGIEHAAPSDQRRATLTVRVVGMSLDVDAQTSIGSR